MLFRFIRESVLILANQYESNISCSGAKKKHSREELEDQYDAAILNCDAKPSTVSIGAVSSPKPPHSRMIKQQQTLPATTEQPVPEKRNKLKVCEISYTKGLKNRKKDQMFSLPL